MISITDKRAPRDYNPSCSFCNDAGCSVCQETIAQAVSAKVLEQRGHELVAQAREFIGNRGMRLNSPTQLVSMSAHDFVEWVMAAMEHGIQFERVRAVPHVVPSQTKCERFERLEIG